MPSLAPSLLLSMPQMMDPNFLRTVVLLCQHDEQGAFGVVINRPATTSGRVTVNLDPPVSTERELEIWIGGPVEPQRSWILVGGDEGEEPLDGVIQIVGGMYLSTSPVLLRRVLEPTPPPRMRLIVGYAGWAAGQLDVELAESSWLMAPVQPDLIFDTPLAAMWETAIRRLGAEPSTLQGSSGVH